MQTLVQKLSCFLSIAILPRTTVFRRESTRYLARYFSPLNFSEVEKFILLTSSNCMQGAIDCDGHAAAFLQEVHFHTDE